MDDSTFRTWMDACGRAYEGRDAYAAAALFTSDATYKWCPFCERETEFRFDYEVLAVTAELGIARWIASADIPSEGRRLLYDGVFAVTLDADNLCREFREWWNTMEAPLA